MIIPTYSQHLFRYGYPEKNISLFPQPMVIDSEEQLKKFIDAYNDLSVENLMTL
jgi:hypothetical protein